MKYLTPFHCVLNRDPQSHTCIYIPKFDVCKGERRALFDSVQFIEQVFKIKLFPNIQPYKSMSQYWHNVEKHKISEDLVNRLTAGGNIEI